MSAIPTPTTARWDRTGGAIMVHGVCSSAGCFSMTDAQIAEIYAIAREAFNGGQRAIQMQSYPFRMTAENLAKHRLDPNIDFWKEIKNGADHFEVTKTEPTVLVCGKHYVFGAHADQEVDASAPCPAKLHRDDQVEAAVAAKEASDESAVGGARRQGRQAGQASSTRTAARTPPSLAAKTWTPARPTRSPPARTEIVLDNSASRSPP